MEALELMVRILTLATAANALWPNELPMKAAIEHSAEATTSGDLYDVDPILLLAIGRCETGFRRHYVSRIDGRDGKRYTGIWNKTEREPFWTGIYYCGFTQAKALTWHACLDLRSVALAYDRGAAEIREWLDDSRCSDDEACAAAGHGNGNAGVDRYRYPTSKKAIEHREWLKRTRETDRTAEKRLDPGWCDKTTPYYERVIAQRDRLRAIVDDLSPPKPVAPSLAFE